MKMRFAVAAGALVLAGGFATGCSSDPAPLAKGALPGGGVEVRIDDKPAATPSVVSCQKMPWFTIVKVGNDTAGITAYVKNETELATDWVSIHNVGGFTGSYNANHADDGNATVGLTGSTYEITGAARGFYANDPESTTTGNFSVKVSC